MGALVRTHSNAAVTKGFSVMWPIVPVRRLDARRNATDIVARGCASVWACEPRVYRKCQKININTKPNSYDRCGSAIGEWELKLPKVYLLVEPESRRSRQ
jgi:hypothetical protein